MSLKPAKHLTRAELLAALNADDRVVEVPTLGPVRIHPITMNDYDAAIQAATGDDGEVDQEIAGYHILAAGAPDLELTADDFASLSNLRAGPLAHLLRAIRDASGIGDDAEVAASPATFRGTPRRGGKVRARRTAGDDGSRVE